MSRDFDARVRDLHEAPLDISSVKGKAGKIKRNRRAAVAGGILGVAAIIAPVAVLANGDGDARSKEPDFAPQTEEAAADPAPTNPDYVLGGRWHQADGDVRRLPDRDYDSAVLWGSRLVATYFDGEVFLIADVIDESGEVVDSFPTTSPIAVNAAGTTIAWINPDTSEVMTTGDDEPVSLGSVDLSAPGEAIAWSVAAITGGPDCLDNDELPACVVYLNSGLGEESRRFDSLGISETVAPGVTKVFDATDDGVVSVINKVTDDLDTCGGLLDQIDTTLRWTTCDYQVQQISPDGAYVAAPPSQYDGVGPSSISVLNTASSEQTATHAPEGLIGQWQWTADSMLVFTEFDGANWHLMTMNPDDGEITEIGDPVKGDEFDSAFTLVNR